MAKELENKEALSKILDTMKDALSSVPVTVDIVLVVNGKEYLKVSHKTDVAYASKIATMFEVMASTINNIDGAMEQKL